MYVCDRPRSRLASVPAIHLRTRRPTSLMSPCTNAHIHTHTRTFMLHRNIHMFSSSSDGSGDAKQFFHKLFKSVAHKRCDAVGSVAAACVGVSRFSANAHHCLSLRLEFGIIENLSKRLVSLYRRDLIWTTHNSPHAVDTQTLRNCTVYRQCSMQSNISSRFHTGVHDARTADGRRVGTLCRRRRVIGVCIQ